jgi:hypothetical protein
MSNTLSKRDTTLKAKCLAFVASHPGCDAEPVPQACRRFLRILASENAIEWRAYDRGLNEGWFTADYIETQPYRKDQ